MFYSIYLSCNILTFIPFKIVYNFILLYITRKQITFDKKAFISVIIDFKISSKKKKKETHKKL
ncbi:hypothetical protein PGB90_004108 [Kerria lacca]